METIGALIGSISTGMVCVVAYSYYTRQRTLLAPDRTIRYWEIILFLAGLYAGGILGAKALSLLIRASG